MIYRLILFKTRKFHIKVIDKIKRHISRSVTFDQKSCRLRDNVENLGTDRLATLYAPLLSPISATCPAHLSLLELINRPEVAYSIGATGLAQR